MAWIALIFCAAIIYSVQRWNRHRATITENLQLIPNCLITRSPILFLGGKASLFYHHNYWNTLPDYLTQHGYEVFRFDLHVRDSKLRLRELTQTFQSLEKQKQKFHLVIDSSSLHEIETLLETQLFESIASVTYLHSQQMHQIQKNETSLRGLKIPIEETFVQADAKTPLFWKLHRLFIQDADQNPACLGLTNQHDLQQIQATLLSRAVELAERDFSQTGNTYDRTQERSC